MKYDDTSFFGQILSQLGSGVTAIVLVLLLTFFSVDFSGFSDVASDINAINDFGSQLAATNGN